MALYLLNDLANELNSMRSEVMEPWLVSRPTYNRRPWRRFNNLDSGSTLQCDKDKFQVSVDVRHFSPDEVQVKVLDDSVLVEAKHEEKQDDHGFVSRQFVRRYVLPQGYDAANVTSTLSSDGVLCVQAPRVAALDAAERRVPITHTGAPHRAVQPVASAATAATDGTKN